MAHVYNGKLVSHKGKETESFVVRWMNLESAIQIEVRQKEKNKYRMLTHIYAIIKRKEKKRKVLKNLRAG